MAHSFLSRRASHDLMALFSRATSFIPRYARPILHVGLLRFAPFRSSCPLARFNTSRNSVCPILSGRHLMACHDAIPNRLGET